jgi:hypothetical protein
VEIPRTKHTMAILTAWQAQAPEGVPYVLLTADRYQRVRTRWQGMKAAGKADGWRNAFMINNVRRTFRTHLKRAGIKATAKLSPHTFRKSCCQNWADRLPMNVVRLARGRKYTPLQFVDSDGMEEEDLRRALVEATQNAFWDSLLEGHNLYEGSYVRAQRGTGEDDLWLPKDIQAFAGSPRRVRPGVVIYSEIPFNADHFWKLWRDAIAVEVPNKRIATVAMAYAGDVPRVNSLASRLHRRQSFHRERIHHSKAVPLFARAPGACTPSPYVASARRSCEAMAFYHTDEQDVFADILAPTLMEYMEDRLFEDIVSHCRYLHFVPVPPDKRLWKPEKDVSFAGIPTVDLFGAADDESRCSF